MNTYNRYILCILIFSFCLSGLAGDQIRGPVEEVFTLKAEAEFEREAEISAGQMVALFVEDSPFLRGVEIEVTLSERLKQYSDSFALEFFYSVTPQPEKGLLVYRGTKGVFQVLPIRNEVILRIPVKSDYAGELGYGTTGNYVMQRAVEAGQFPALFTVQTVLKGIPDSVLAKKFYVKIKPILEKAGYLNLRVTTAQGGEPLGVSYYIDDQLVDYNGEPLFIKSGIHSLRVESVRYRAETSSFSIESGQTVELALQLEDLVPEVLVDLHPGTELFVDGEKVELTGEAGGMPLEMEEGEHTFLVKVSEYSVSRTLYIQNGKKYNISIFFDFDIKED